MEHPECSWGGVTEDGQTRDPCGRPAHFFVQDREGRKIFACPEHLAYAQSVSEAGAVVHPIPPPVPVRETPTIVD